MFLRQHILILILVLIPKIIISQCEQSINLNASLSAGQYQEVYTELELNVSNIIFNLSNYYSDGGWQIPRDFPEREQVCTKYLPPSQSDPKLSKISYIEESRLPR